MSRLVTDGGRPTWLGPALRAGLEMTLVALIATYLAVHVESPVWTAVVAVAGTVGVVAVLFWAVNEQVLAWVRYASNQGRRNRRRRSR